VADRLTNQSISQTVLLVGREFNKKLLRVLRGTPSIPMLCFMILGLPVLGVCYHTGITQFGL
jgi:hypothetical protein